MSEQTAESVYTVWVNNTTWEEDAPDMQSAWEATKKQIKAPHWSDKKFTAHIDIYLKETKG